MAERFAFWLALARKQPPTQFPPAALLLPAIWKFPKPERTTIMFYPEFKNQRESENKQRVTIGACRRYGCIG